MTKKKSNTTSLKKGLTMLYLNYLLKASLVAVIAVGICVNYSWAEQTYVWGNDGSLTIVTSDTPPTITYKTNPDTNVVETEISVMPEKGERAYILGDELTVIENTSLGIITY